MGDRWEIGRRSSGDRNLLEREEYASDGRVERGGDAGGRAHRDEISRVEILVEEPALGAGRLAASAEDDVVQVEDLRRRDARARLRGAMRRQ